MAQPQLVHLELDEKDKEQLQELQQSMGQAQQELAMLRQKTAMRESEKRRADLTLGELDGLPTDAKAYKQVGKMFLLQPLPGLVTALTEKSASCEKESAALKEKLTHVESVSEKVEQDFNEFVKGHMVTGGGE